MTVVLKAAPDHGARAKTDERADLAGRHGFEMALGERMVGCPYQVGRGLDQRAVEIEHDGQVAHA